MSVARAEAGPERSAPGRMAWLPISVLASAQFVMALTNGLVDRVSANPAISPAPTRP
jgi:hypothetical protein